jgi:putative ABC transport system permease protein
MNRPPLLPRILLRLFLPSRLFDAISGDLREDWDRGRLDRIQYWTLSLRSIADCWVDRLRNRRQPAANDDLSVRGDGPMRSMFQDVRYAARMMRRHPGFTSAAVATLAVGIGATSAIFGLVKVLALEPLPYHEPSRVTFLLGTDTASGGLRFSMRLADYLDIRERAQTFAAIAAYSAVGGNLTGGDLPERVQAYRVTGELFDLLGASPVRGRTLSPADAQPGRDTVAVISAGLWQQRFGGDPSVIGRRISLNGVTHEIVGVMPSRFEFPVFNFKGDLWVPWAFDAATASTDRRASGSATVIGRLRDGVTIDAAAAEMHAVMQTLATEHPHANGTLGVRVVEMGRLGDEQVAPALVMIGATATIVLLLACANVANLLLARGASRGRELAVRAAVGASRGRIVRLLLVESAILAVLGGLVGIGLASLALGALRAALPQMVLSTVPNIDTLGVDRDTLVFTLAVALLASLVFGLLPAARAARPQLHDALKASGPGGGRGTRRLRSSLIVAEVILATVLVIGAGLLARSYASLRAVDPGFTADGVLTMAMTLPEDRYPTGIDRQQFFEAVTDRVQAVAGVEAAGFVNALPFSTYDSGTRVEIEGLPSARGRDLFTAYRVISPAYFATMAIPVERGQAFAANDGSGGFPAAVVNAAFASRYLEGDAVGRRVRVGHGEAGGPWMTIVGVVGDVHHSQLTQTPGPQLYVPLAQDVPSTMMLAVRTAGPPEDLVPVIRAEIAAVAPGQPVFHVKPMTTLVSDALLPQTMSAALMGLFSGIALLLAVIGVYGVISYGVAEQMPEFGVRLALGATPAELVRHVMRRGMRLVATGLLIGIFGAFLLTQTLASLLFGVTPLDPWTFAAAAGVIAAFGLVATAIPAWRASTADPLSALRID